MRKYNWGIIGPGKIARKFVEDLQLLPEAVLYGVASRNKERSKVFAEEYQMARYYDDYTALIEDPAIDIVYVATPHVGHKENTIRCLRNGKAVLCEKPLGLDGKEVEEMVQCARETNSFLMEAMWTAFLPHFRYVERLIAEERLGKVKHLKSDFGFKANYDPEKRLFNKDLGGGSLLDIGIYPVFCALALLGTPVKVKASGTFSETGVDEQMNALFEYGEAIALLESSLINTTDTETKITCENGSVLIRGRWHEPTEVFVENENGSEVIQFDTIGRGYYYEAQEVMNCLNRNEIESSIMTLDRSISLMRLMDQIKKEINLNY